jgi:hypothetical protein
MQGFSLEKRIRVVNGPYSGVLSTVAYFEYLSVALKVTTSISTPYSISFFMLTITTLRESYMLGTCSYNVRLVHTFNIYSLSCQKHLRICSIIL